MFCGANAMRSDVKVKPYFRKANEGPEAWAAFLIFRNSGSNRQLTAVARELNITPQQVSKWSRAHNWKQRVLIYDRENEAAKRKAELEAIERMRARHIETALKLQKLGETEIEKLLAHAEANASLAIDPKLALEYLKQGAEQERLNRGQPSEIVATIEETPPDIKGLDVTELEMLRVMYMKMKSKKEGGESDD
jgi:transposase-like protein